jgi:hypothetical protein
MARAKLDPRDAAEAGRRLAARLLADEAQDIAASVLRANHMEIEIFEHGIVIVARRKPAAHLMRWLLEHSDPTVTSVEAVPATDWDGSDE